MKFNIPTNKKLYIRVNVALIGTVIALCAGLVILSSCILMQTVERDIYILCIDISIVVLSLLAIGLTVSTIKAASRKPSEEILALLKRFKSQGGFTHHFGSEASDSEIAAALDEMMGELHGLLQSVQLKAQAIDRDVETLTKGIHQVTADQNNLFSLSAAIESVRPQQNGFSVISSEILSLVRRSGDLTENVRCLADQLRAGVNEIIVELEHALRRVDPTLTSMPIDASARPGQQDSSAQP